MKNINNQELAKIEGGISSTLWGGIVVGIVFLASVIYGIINPNKCS